MTKATGKTVTVYGQTEVTRDLMDARIASRVVQMWADGFVDEVRALERVGMSVSDVEIIPLNLAETEAALLDGEVDAIVTVDGGATAR